MRTDWIKVPYEGTIVMHIWPITQIGTVTFDNGVKGTLAWDPKTMDLVMEVPDQKMAYRFPLQRLLNRLEVQVIEQQSLIVARSLFKGVDEGRPDYEGGGPWIPPGEGDI